MSAEEFMAVVNEISGVLPAEALTASEREFLLQHTDVTAEELSDDGRALTQVAVLAGRARAEAEFADTALTTSQVARLLGRAESNVRRSHLNGSLYSPGTGGGQTRLFPRWQFTTDDRVLPGLKEILAALPQDLHPLSVARFMTTPNAALDGVSPVAWLTSGGPTTPVVTLADELAYL